MQLVNYKSYYDQNFSIEHQKYEGPQYDTIACILPGQGLIKPGFLKTDLKKLASVQVFLSRADQWLKSYHPEFKFSVTDYSNRPENISDNHLQIVQNIFLLSVSCGFFDLLQSKGYDKFIITSHSFGEYSSLVCAGCIDFEMMLEIVWMREMCSPAAHSKGSLIALNSKIEDFNSFKLQTAELANTHIANINSHQQIVIAVDNTDKATVIKALKKLKIAHKSLSAVAQPYHSNLMDESANKFRQWLQTINLNPQPLKHALLSSVNQKSYPANYMFTKSELVEIFACQLTSKVDFVEQVHSLKKEHNIVSFIQLIEGDVYTNFIQNMFQPNELKMLQLSSVDFFYKTNTNADQISRLDLEKLKTSQIFKRLAEHIESVTGFSVLEIEIMDQFQSDLRIDSIKKAEIVFKTLEDFNIHIEESLSLAQFKTIAEVVHYLDSVKYNKKSIQKKSIMNNKNNFMNTFSIAEVAEAIESTPSYKDLNTKKVSILFHSISEDEIILAKKVTFDPIDILVLDVSNLDGFFNSKLFGVDSFLNLFSFLKTRLEDVKNIFQQNSFFKLVIFSRTEYIHLQALRAFVKSFCKEHHIPLKCIQVLEDIDQSNLSELIIAESSDNYITDIVYKNGERYIKKWSSLNNVNRDHKNQIKNIVVIGGAKGFAGAQLSRFKKSDLNIYLIGRSDSDTSDIVQYIKKNKAKFGLLKYVKCDASNEKELTNSLNFIVQDLGSIDLVINAAGQEKSEELLNKTIDSAAGEFLSKYSVSQNLQILLKTFGFKVINYSSIVGYFGNEGQAVYSFANGYQYDLDTINILWPAIDKVGMTTNKGLYEKMRATGLHFAKIEETVELIQDVITYYDAYKNESRNILYTHPQDVFLFESKLLDLQRLRSLAGQIVSLEDVSFSKEFHLLRDSFLNDHKIENTAVIPASYIVSLFLNIARYYIKNIKLELFSIKNILLFTQNQLNCELNLSPKMTQIKNKNQLSSFDCSVSSHVDNYAAQVNQYFPNERILFRSSAQYLNTIMMNTIYSEECVNFGYKFQLINDIYFSKEKDRFEILGVSTDKLFYYSGDVRFDSIMFLVESAFQMACVNGLLTDKGLGIPSRFESLVIYKLDFKKLYIVPEILNVTSLGQGFFCNVVICNENNERIAELKKIEMTPIKVFSNSPLKFEAKVNVL